MNRLIAFGCSHTYGKGLDDCFVEGDLFKTAPTPSKFAWPSLLAEKLGYECVNNSIPAGSNLEILYSILNYDFQEGDKVVVGWTTPKRDVISTLDGKMKIASFLIDGRFNSQLDKIITDLFPGLDPEKVMSINKSYFQVHSDRDMSDRSWIHQYTAGMHLKSKNIEFYFVSIWDWLSCPDNIISFIHCENFLRELDLADSLDFAKDNLHLGTTSHRLLSEEILSSVDW